VAERSVSERALKAFVRERSAKCAWRGLWPSHSPSRWRASYVIDEGVGVRSEMLVSAHVHGGVMGGANVEFSVEGALWDVCGG
jgi:hypothetical protein